MIKIFGYKLYSGYIINNNKILAYSLNYNKNDLINHLNKIKSFHKLNSNITFSDELDKKFEYILNDRNQIIKFRKSLNLNFYRYKEIYEYLINLDKDYITYKDLIGYFKNKYNVFQIIYALKYNPFIIIVPCHKVIKNINDIGNYTPLGKEFKKILLNNLI